MTEIEAQKVLLSVKRGSPCPCCLTVLFCHCESCFERNKDKTPYLWEENGQVQYCSACGHRMSADEDLDLEMRRMRFAEKLLANSEAATAQTQRSRTRA